MCRACHRCKEYVVISSSDPKNQIIVKTFESNHSGHPIISISHGEVKDYYTNVGKEMADNL